ncbi:alkaline phosphatase family protein [Pedobacter metabolipauper]|uniref:Type I phosphodiesterase/nucleotide pyrophosphatase n=1 Tax=Pedobacter metabolipauper TaxID=425513 RepID=A0A4R6SSH8_9SPHI|nr:alkaline phosphatase family protein [Pedobacter metabolipauper]TDQ06358.1 type I phosphodiesterase/nucleotide pyrophosphatase [Pedobacter metabolipauper]
MKTNPFILYSRRSAFSMLSTFSALLIFCGAVMTGCNKDFETKISDKEYSDSVSIAFGNPKVILLIVDGARGTSVRDARTPVLTSMLPASIYSWNSVADEENPQEGTNWADMLTGVKKDKHGVIGNDFTANKFENYPLIFSRIKKARPNTRIVSYASSALFKEKLSKDVDLSEVPGTDAGVKTALVNALKTDTASFLVGQFKEVNQAGATSGYDVSKAGYKDAIVKFDTQVGEVLAAMKSRPGYATENWLVVVVSNNGGDYPTPPELDDKTVFSNSKVNTFTIIHNPKYKTRFIGKPYLGNKYNGRGVRIYGQNVKAEVTNSGDFNFGDTTQFTLEIKVKKNIGPNNNYRFYYPSILGKRPEWSSGGPTVGWVVFIEDNFWMFNLRGIKSSGTSQVRGGDLSNGNWNTLGVVCVNRDGKRFVRTFTDGNFNNEMEITSFGSLNNNSPLTLGYIPGNGHREPDATLTDIRIWRKALPDTIVKKFACDTDVSEDHPYYGFLLGYWPATDGSGGQLADLGYSGNNFILKGNYEWSNFSDLICAPSASNISALVPRNMDVATQLLSWFKIPTQESWNLNGRVWLDQ